MSSKSVVMENIPDWYAPFLSSNWFEAKGVEGSRAYAVTHVRNKNSNIQGRSPNVVK